jgi:hypothetical protein
VVERDKERGKEKERRVSAQARQRERARAAHDEVHAQSMSVRIKMSKGIMNALCMHCVCILYSLRCVYHCWGCACVYRCLFVCMCARVLSDAFANAVRDDLLAAQIAHLPPPLSVSCMANWTHNGVGRVLTGRWMRGGGGGRHVSRHDGYSV